MSLMDTITARTSIRKFRPDEVDPALIRDILEAAIRAPSAKNFQPWHFVVVSGAKKQEMVQTFTQVLEEAARNPDPTAPNAKQMLAAAQYTAKLMGEAPVTIFVLNTMIPADHLVQSGMEQRMMLSLVQSVSAAIENMLLRITDLGLGAFWNCDVFFAYDALVKWLDTPHQLIAAVTLGHPAEQPQPRPRKPLDDVVTWLQ
ncbi:nitroreductase family protein [Ruminococcaceae bacterium OttesenSCG-928-L11]|nr:nitroreductase family protein [Ruminococcaceae bacterium OttesenSCG-928-L11]